MLTSIFVAELITPSLCLWLISPWISDILVIDNTANTSLYLEPFWTRSRIYLSQVLATLVERGTTVHIATHPDARREIKVHLSHDKGGNDRLLQWVRNSHIVVMVTASAKHAATNFIEANRPSHLMLILLVNSKGSASMLRTIGEHLAQ